MHDNSWFIEVVPINMLSCHRQHINNIRHGWHFCSQFSLKLLQCMDQQIFWPLYANSTFSQFVHWVISCDYMIIFVYSMVGWVICHLILFRVLIKRVSGFTVSEVCAYEMMFSMVLLWQWDFQGSVMSCNSKALEPYPCSDAQKHPLTTS